ncbi:MAG: leishmanolysin-related zinc metalloendopeptidase [Myxococcota bacterium]
MHRLIFLLVAVVSVSCGDREARQVPFTELSGADGSSVDGASATNPPPSVAALDPSVTGFDGSLRAVTSTFQGAVPGRSVAERPMIQLLDAQGIPRAGINVEFELITEGSLGTNRTFTDAQGFAEVSEWRVGTSVGLYGLEAIAGGARLVFVAEATSSFNIQLRFENDVSESIRASFLAAAARWSGVIRSDLSDITLDLADLPSDCSTDESGATRIDDLLVLVEVREIDGEGRVLGQAGPCLIRTADRSPLVGKMEFDLADLSRLRSRGLLDDTILHEMGHVLGIGVLWDGLLENPSVPGNSQADTRFLGDSATARYQELGGSGFVPVENSGVRGSADGHWRESVFDNELMTPQLTFGDGQLPLSAVTVGSLEDLGIYDVNYDAADQYSAFNPGVAALRLLEPVDLGEVLLVPRYRVDDEGVVYPMSDGSRLR